jgi:magnesium transporter
VIATVFLPLSFIVAFFGQNFAWLNRQTDSFAAFAGLGGGGLLLAGLVLFTFLRRSRVI